MNEEVINVGILVEKDDDFITNINEERAIATNAKLTLNY
jgi:hypothetical protein